MARDVKDAMSAVASDTTQKGDCSKGTALRRDCSQRSPLRRSPDSESVESLGFTGDAPLNYRLPSEEQEY
jgi:hypothetical protein